MLKITLLPYLKMREEIRIREIFLPSLFLAWNLKQYSFYIIEAGQHKSSEQTVQICILYFSYMA